MSDTEYLVLVQDW